MGPLELMAWLENLILDWAGVVLSIVVAFEFVRGTLMDSERR